MVGKRTASIVRAMRNARFTPPNGGPKEKLAFINRHEADLLRSLGGSGRRTKLGVPSFSWRDNSSSANANSTNDGNGGSMDAGGNVSGTGSGSGAGGGGGLMGGGQLKASTFNFPTAPIARPVVPVVRPVVPIPRMKPPVPQPGFLGPNSPLAQSSLPQIGGTTYADMMTAAINAGQPSTTPNVNPGSSYGAPGGVDNPANNDTGGGGGEITRADVPGLSGTFDGGRRFGDQRTIGSPAQPAAPASPTRSIGTTPLTMQRQPFSTYIRSPYKNPATYTPPGKIPDRNPYLEPDHPVIANTPNALEQYGPIDQWKAQMAAAARRKTFTDRIPATSGNFRPGSVFSPDRSQPRSPDPRDQRAY